MPDLRPVLDDYDLGLLRVMAGLWGLELEATSQRDAAQELAAQLLQADRVAQMVEALPPEARAALRVVARDRMLLATFTRKYGELRPMGPARRDREQPWANAPSPAEVLWYRGLIARAFFDVGSGPQEFIFIPEDLRVLLPLAEDESQPAAPPGHETEAPEDYEPLSGCAADDAATLLAYLQVHTVKPQPDPAQPATFPNKPRRELEPFLRCAAGLDFFFSLLLQLGLVSGAPFKLDPAKARPFLEASRAEQIKTLAGAWRDSQEWNDLLHVPGLIFEGQGWRNDPRSARQAILNLLAQAPVGVWWSLDSFAAAVKDRQPDFQRPAGDYDSWYIRDAGSHDYLRGFENWDRVDGALVRWVIQRPMCWLGLVDVFTAQHVDEQRKASDPDSTNAAVEESAFRLTTYGAAFLGRGDWPNTEASAPVQVSAEGTLRIPASARRYDRFQAARISDWLTREGDEYVYRLTPSALARAVQRGITIRRVVAFLQTLVGEDTVPPSLIGALHRWERAGREAALKDTVVLKLRSNELLETLRRTPLVQRYLGESLGLATVEVRREDVEKLRAALAEVGILVDN